MNKIYKKSKKIGLIYIMASVIVCFGIMLGDGWFYNIISETFYKDYYTLYINGEKAGSSLNEKTLEEAYRAARIRINYESDELKFVDADMEIKKTKRLRASTNDKYEIEKLSYDMLCESINSDMKKAYVINVDGYILTLESLSEVIYMFNEVKNTYTEDDGFQNYMNVNEKFGRTYITLDVAKSGLQVNDVPTVSASENANGMDDVAADEVNSETADGVKNVQFGENVEIIPCYVDRKQMDNVNDELLKSKTGTEAITVIVDERKTYTEEYVVDTQYVYNDNLYNTEQNVIQNGSNGTKEIAADITYKNGVEVNRVIIKETVIKEAVPQIIELGTVNPPTYVKPIKGGRFSSGYGFRWGTTHKGIDWACNVGTDVFASCDGKVIQAGWVNGYGYCVTLQHSDGNKTRYAHLSKILVSAGQRVSQYETIALSGNTGNSTGPHVHFEIIVDGAAVNPYEIMQ